MSILFNDIPCACGCSSFTLVQEENLYCNRCNERFIQQVKIISTKSMFGDAIDEHNNGKIINKIHSLD
ncbi:hypothetical protein SAMN06313486_10162 [Epsilonproteobacteria bacterium SCGC AD-308-P11]|jgi:hypothetical protein|nr:hypothetical protein SAMN06313486_10162 [Epsilonproteobacteria bacterium SCGC AD-308-P11]